MAFLIKLLNLAGCPTLSHESIKPYPTLLRFSTKTIIVKGKMTEVPYEKGKKPCIRIYNSSQIKIAKEKTEIIEAVDL